MIQANSAYDIIHVAGRSAMRLAGPGHLNEEASSAYKALSEEEQERLKYEADVKENRLTKREVIKRGERYLPEFSIW